MESFATIGFRVVWILTIIVGKIIILIYTIDDVGVVLIVEVFFSVEVVTIMSSLVVLGGHSPLALLCGLTILLTYLLVSLTTSFLDILPHLNFMHTKTRKFHKWRTYMQVLKKNIYAQRVPPGVQTSLLGNIVNKDKFDFT